MGTDLAGLVKASNADIRGKLLTLEEADLGLSSPCDGWTVGDIVDHVTDSNVWTGDLLVTGDFETQAEDREPALTDRASRVASWEASVRLLDRGIAKGIDRIVRHPLGPTPAHRLLFFRSLDTLIHGWDIARSVGADESLDQEVVSACLDILEPIALMLCATGMYAPPVSVSPGASAQQQLLGIVGRRSDTVA